MCAAYDKYNRAKTKHINFKHVKSLDEIEIADIECDNNLLYSILDSFGLYLDVARIIHSYCYGYTKYEELELPQELKTNPIWHMIGNIVCTFNRSHVFVIKDKIVELKRHPNSLNVELMNTHERFCFMYNDIIYIYNNISLYTFEVIENMYKILFIKQYPALIEFIDDKYNDMTYVYYRYYYKIMQVDCKICYIKYDYNQSKTIMYASKVESFINDNVLFSIKYKTIANQCNDIDRYLLNDWSKVIYKVHNRSINKWIYLFYKDSEFYEYHSSVCLICGHSDIAIECCDYNEFNHSQIECVLISRISRKIRKNEKNKPFNAAKIPMQSNQLILPNPTKGSYITDCNMLSNNIMYICSKTDEMRHLCQNMILKLY